VQRPGDEQTSVSEPCFESGKLTEQPMRRYLPTVRGETQIVSFCFNSLAIRSSRKVGFLAAILRIH
jgi:hypothetical protein